MPVPGKLGRLPRDPRRPSLSLADYLTYDGASGGLPQIDTDRDIDYVSAVGYASQWPMYCNGPDPENALCCPGSPDGCGDCAWAYWGHAIESWTAYATGERVTVPAANIIAAYADCTGYDPQTGANDNGTQLLDALEYMRQTGIPDAGGTVHKIAGYAELKTLTGTAGAELYAQALYLGGSLYCGANLQQAQEDQFSADQPWDYVSGSPVIGGHAFGLQQRRGNGGGDYRYRDITWGAPWSASWNFHEYCVDEVYFVVSQDDIEAGGTNRAGVNLDQLLADMSKIS